MIVMNIIKQNVPYIRKYWFKCIGILSSILSILFLFISWEDINMKELNQRVMLLIGACLLLLFWGALWICVLKKKNIIWQRSSSKIIVLYADIIKEAFQKKSGKERLYVIPVNSTFDTIVDADISLYSKPLISPKSLHGKWIKKMEESGKNLMDLDREIQHSLELYHIEPIKILTETQKQRGKREVYELGTVVVVKGNENVSFLLLALTDFDENNNSHVSVQEFEYIIKDLIEFYNQHGQGYDLMIPLMGTNLSRANISHEESLRIIISRLLLYKNSIRGDVSVVVYPGDKDKVTIDI